MARLTRIAILLAVCAASARPVAAQDADFALRDRIVAIVGDSVIPLSRVEEELNVYQQRGGKLPDDSAGRVELRRQILRQIIDQELLVQAALRDTTVVVSDQEVQSAADRALREVRSQFASELEFRRQIEATNFSSPDEYRRWLADQQRRELLQSQFVQRLRDAGKLKPLAPTESELRAFYEQTRSQQPARPATVGFRQVVVRVEADSAALASAYARADSLARVLRGEGADFAAVARQYSADPGSRNQGGELGWVRRGVLVAEFESVAFRVRPGVIAGPVRTVFGFHIIQVQRSQPAEVQVRHILIAPELTEADRARARARADTVAQALRSGAAFDSLVDLYHDKAGQEQSLVEDFPLTDLPAAYRDVLQGAAPGTLLGPLLIDLGDGRPKFAVILVDLVRTAGEYSFEDLRDRLRSMLAEQNAMERFLESLRKATYIEIRL